MPRVPYSQALYEDAQVVRRVEHAYMPRTDTELMVYEVGASQYPIGVPGPGFASNNARPVAVQLRRQSGDWFMRMDTTAHTNLAAYLAQGLVYEYNLHPSVNTIFVTATEGTALARVNWIYLDPSA